MEEYNPDTLNELDKDALIQVIRWTINDVNTWANNEGVNEKVQGFAAMLEEAILYQITKELQKLEEE